MGLDIRRLLEGSPLWLWGEPREVTSRRTRRFSHRAPLRRYRSAEAPESEDRGSGTPTCIPIPSTMIA